MQGRTFCCDLVSACRDSSPRFLAVVVEHYPAVLALPAEGSWDTCGLPLLAFGTICFAARQTSPVWADISGACGWEDVVTSSPEVVVSNGL